MKNFYGQLSILKLYKLGIENILNTFFLCKKPLIILKIGINQIYPEYKLLKTNNNLI